MNDIYDVLVVLLEHAARTGLLEHLAADARNIIEKADPKVAEKRKAAEAAKATADEQYQRFLAFQAMEQRASQPAEAPAPAAPPPAGPFVPPVVNG